MTTSKQEADKSVVGNKRKIESLKIENLMSKTEKVSSVSKTSVPSIGLVSQSVWPYTLYALFIFSAIFAFRFSQGCLNQLIAIYQNIERE